MEKYCPAFQSCQHLFSEIDAFGIFRESQEYSGIESCEEVLLLGDRILACRQHPELDKVEEIEKLLTRLGQKCNSDVKLAGDAYDLLLKIEIWFNALVWLVNPVEYKKKQERDSGKSNFGEAALVLDILSEDDIKKHSNDISDAVRQKILCAKEDRNLDVHETEKLPDEVRQRLVLETMVTLVAPIYKHYKALQNALMCLITRDFGELGNLKNVMKSMASERQSHLEHFGGRKAILKNLCQRLTKKTGSRYILLTGVEGSGKSAISAKLSEIVASQAKSFGKNASQVKMTAPWLPGVLFFHGKQSNQVDEIMQILLLQANCMLLTPVTFPEIDTQSMDYHTAMPFEKKLSSPKLSFSSKRQDLQRICFLKSISSEIFGSCPEKLSRGNKYSKILYAMLESLAKERGKAILILDAIEEISSDGTGLDFLPKCLPGSAFVVLTCRQGTMAEEWLKNRRSAMTIALPALEREEVSEILGLKDEDTKSREFNGQVFQKTSGLPSFVCNVRSQIGLQKPLQEIEIIQDIEALCKQKAALWSSPVLKKVLPLLAIFEPVTPLELSLVQGFLLHQEILLSLPELRDSLIPVEDQIHGLDANYIKLASKTFAEYLKSSYFSVRDLGIESVVVWLASEEEASAEIMASFLDYWTDPKQISEKFCLKAEKLIGELQSKHKREILRDIATINLGKKCPQGQKGHAINALFAAAKLRDSVAMGCLGICLIKGIKLNQDIAEGEKWLRNAAKAKNAEAMRVLGCYLLEGDKLNQNIREGKEWLRNASESGYAVAMKDLGDYLIKGDKFGQNIFGQNIFGQNIFGQNIFGQNIFGQNIFGQSIFGQSIFGQNIAEGEKWLRNASMSNNIKAMRLLGHYLIEGDKLSQNFEEGEKWLRKAVEAEDVEAMKILGDYLIKKDQIELNLGAKWLRLIKGAKFKQNLKEGERLLRRAAESQNAAAMRILGDYLIKGDKLKQDIVEGEKWLRRAYEANDTIAMRILGVYLIKRDKLKQDIAEGEKWLRNAAEAKDVEAMRILGNHLIEGKKFQSDIAKRILMTEGKEWLRKAAEAKDVEAMRILGNHLIEEKQSEQEGEEWLLRAAQAKDVEAMRILGLHRIKKFPRVSKNNFGPPYQAQIVSDGEEWLRRASEAEDAIAMRILGVYLIGGYELNQNIEEGEKWLRKAAEAKDILAMPFLGDFLIKGDRLRQNVAEGEQWLRKGAEAGGIYALRILGDYLIKGDKLKQDIVEGEKYLRIVAKEKDVEAMRILGVYLIEGDKLKQNIVEGEQWLRNAAEAKDVEAMKALGFFLIKGDKLKQNIAEGEKWLRIASGK